MWHADGDREEVAVLAQLERGGQHRRAPGATTGQLRTRLVPQRQTHAVCFSASGQRRKWVRVGPEVPSRAGLLGDGTLSLVRRSFQID